MKKNILIIGSTGKLGTKLLKFLSKNSISVYGITCYKNNSKLSLQKKLYSIKNSFVLSRNEEKAKFLNFLKKKIHIIYFLDYGSMSLQYLKPFLNFNQNSIIAVANKEMIIAGGTFLQKKIKQTNNTFVPLDSEHFSIFNSNIKNDNIIKIYITASGGPFYFNKKINLSNVSYSKVLSHPKWNMGTNNLIDSSNFINKILEIYELSYIYNVSLNKIDFLISKEAYIHSLIYFVDITISINCFRNDMLITLIKPLTYFYKIKPMKINQNYLDKGKLMLEIPKDKRFKVFTNKKKLMKLSHSDQIKLMIINNSAHKLYLSNKLKYSNIFNYIMKEISKNSKDINLNSFKSILNFITKYNDLYKTNV